MFELEVPSKFLSPRTLILGSDLLKGQGIQRVRRSLAILEMELKAASTQQEGGQVDRCLLFKGEKKKKRSKLLPKKGGI